MAHSHDHTNDSNASRRGQPSAVAIYVALVALLFVSIGAGALGARQLATAFIFLIAFVKAGLVVSYYMHLRLEPRWIAILFASAVLCVAVLFAGLYPDMVHVYGG